MARASRQISLPYIKIDRGSDMPLYQQLYEGIRGAILAGVLKAGDRLPATRLIGEELGVSRNIVVMAFEQLGMEGYIQGRGGSGSYVAGEVGATSYKLQAASGEGERGATSYKLQAASEEGEVGATSYKLQAASGEGERGAASYELQAASGEGDGGERRRLEGDFIRTLERVVLPRNTVREEVVPFQTGEPAFDVFPFGIWSKLAARVYRYLDFQHLGYDDVGGHLPLREAIADHLRVNRGVQCDAGRILIVNGTQQALALCAQLLLEPGDQFWIDNPGYVNARAVFTLFGGVACPVPVTPDGTDVDFGMRHYPRARLAYLTPSHQDPVGGTMPLAQRLKLLAFAKEQRLWLIEDDYDSELRYRGKPIPSLQGMDAHGNVIYIGTFSKVLFPALRVGYMVLPEGEVLRAFRSLKALNDRMPALTDQLILTEFIKEGYFHRHLRKMRMVYNARLQCLLGELHKHLGDELRFTDPAAGMHLAAWFKRPVDEVTLLGAAREMGLVVPSLRDYTIGDYERPGILLGYAAFSEEKIKQAVKGLAACFSKIS